MKVLLVVPPFTGEERYGRLHRAGSYLPPLGLLSIAAFIRGTHDVRLIDGSLPSVTAADVLAAVRDWQPSVIGISVMTPVLHRALTLCCEIKTLDPAIVTVLGGPHPSALPEDTASRDGVDYVVAGEGERTFAELLACLSAKTDPATVPGLAFRSTSGVIATPPRERIADLDSLPMPAWDLIDHQAYAPSSLHYRHRPVFSIVCGRGCPYRCTFCSCAKVFRGRVTMRSPENVIAEIRMLRERYGAREIMIWDDTFGLSADWLVRFCELIRPLRLLWSAWMRCDLADPGRLRAMAASGCWHISYGVESGDQQVLDIIRKGQTLDDIRAAFRHTRAAGMEARGTFILGLPGDTLESMERTIDLAIEIDADYAQFQLLTPYPGTELGERAGEYGEFVDRDWGKYTIWFPVFVPKGLTRGDLTAAHRCAHRRFYLRPTYVLRRFSQIRSFSDLRRNFTGLSSILSFLSHRD